MDNSAYVTETREEIAEKFFRFTYKGMPYRLYVPENYRENQSYPLVLFLHGGGERGNDNESHILSSDGAVVWATAENQAKYSAFVLAPQSRNLPHGGFGITRNHHNQINLSRLFEPSDDLLMAHEILQSIRGEFSIDPNRLYCTGLSQGGFGTYNLNILFPKLFAAMVPIAGGGDPEKANVLAKKPLWNFHAEDDEIIPVSYSREIIASIKRAGGNPRYTEYPAQLGYGHGSWVPTYASKKMVEWMFQQVKIDG
ncbi:alpha/beta hydrolase-fold protein [Bacillus sp. SD088]|uniref:carboxylesterase family protein n=1 Tax=Bacillus sp. SD088 TaxID=2782012 RepID=UPI001A96C68A|nr:alpha/beta hydrolase-fold protein [Bacillus sp. SD088]MBO0991690.1 phospholipase [Bacillus sp. SD088]